jgi:hypothetical protein
MTLSQSIAIYRCQRKFLTVNLTVKLVSRAQEEINFKELEAFAFYRHLLLSIGRTSLAPPAAIKNPASSNEGLRHDRTSLRSSTYLRVLTLTFQTLICLTLWTLMVVTYCFQMVK